MKRALCLVLLLVCLDVGILSAAPQTAPVPPFPNELRDPAFLQQLTWQADKGLESVIAEWPKYSGNQGFEDKIVQRQTTMSILESSFSAQYRTYKTKGDAEIVILRSADGVTTDCDALSTWAEQAFGPPQTPTNLSMPKRDYSFTDLRADWLFGETRVQFSCSGVWVADKFVPVVVSLRYNHRDRLAALEEPVHIKCSSQQRYIGGNDQTVREAPPVAFIIDPVYKNLLREADNTSFGKTETFTNTEIVAGFEDEKVVVQIRIDRVAASYRLTSRLKNALSSLSGLEQWGDCVPVAPGKKF